MKDGDLKDYGERIRREWEEMLWLEEIAEIRRQIKDMPRSDKARELHALPFIKRLI